MRRLAAFPAGRLERADLVAGLCVAGLLMPEAVAYASLAHLPVHHALAAMLAGLLVYAFLGGSRFAVVAPTSSAATLAAAAVLSVPYATTGAPLYAPAFFALVLCAGALLLILGLLRQGQIAAFVSRPVLRGFAFALALTIVVKQLPDALGLSVPAEQTQDPLHVFLYVISHAAQWHGPSVAVAVVAALSLGLLSRWRQWPGALITLVLAVLAAHALALPVLGVHEVGAMDAPPLRLEWPDLPQTEWFRLGELAFGLVMIVFAESWGSMRTLALAHGDRLDADRELLALGACNLASALFQGMPVGAGFSASSANASAGAQSRWSGVVALAVVAMAVFFALPALRHVPRPVLAVVVIHALLHALNPGPLLATWRSGRDRLPMVGAALAVLGLGVLHGMLTGVALSLLTALHRFSQPVVHELGELAGTRDYLIVDGRPSLARHAGLLILRPEEPLFFANVDRVSMDVMRRAQGLEAGGTVILSLEESSDLDSTALESLRELKQRLANLGLHLVLSRVKDAVRELLARADGTGLGHEGKLYWSVADAVDACRQTPQDSQRTQP